MKFKVNIWKNIPKELMNNCNEKATKKDYMNVYVFETLEDMYNFVDKKEKNKIDRCYGARCYSYTRAYQNSKTKEIIKYSPLCGNLYFIKDNMETGTISHECCHAILGYFNRKIKEYQRVFTIENDIIKEQDIEELFCYMQGSLVSQIYTCYYERTLESEK